MYSKEVFIENDPSWEKAFSTNWIGVPIIALSLGGTSSSDHLPRELNGVAMIQFLMREVPMNRTATRDLRE